ncbi:hypothetical protein GCM10009680_30540 [Streptomyces yatensis]|uniref:Uncharacterized protein n=1 Tax=Streptomyces yatensis TaxID=155177 RepID=A0ABN2HK00_9ACTN
MTSSASATARRTGTISDPQRMTRRGGRHRPAETDGGEEAEGAEEAGAGDGAGGAPGVPGVSGEELRGGSGETVIGRRLSAAGW